MNHIVLGQGENCIIFLHGWGGSTDSFWGVAKLFADKYKCILVDFYGFGKSKLDRPMDLHNYAQGIVDIMHKYSIKNPILVGHSFGGRVAILLASQYKEIKGVVLVDSAGLKPRLNAKVVARKLSFKLRKFFRMDTSKSGSPDYRKLSDDMKVTFKNIVNEHLDDKLKEIQCPTLIVWGNKDKDTPMYMAKKLNKNIKDSGLVILKGGHYSYLDEWSKFIAVLDSYFDSICR